MMLQKYASGKTQEPKPFNPIRLKQAREAKRLTQANLATAIGELEQTITMLEAGSLVPTKELKAKLSWELGFPVGFFHRDNPPEFGRGSLEWH